MQVDPSGTASYDYFGVNHLGWLYGFPDRASVPLKYWKLHFEPERVLDGQRRSSRAAELQRLSRAAFDAYRLGCRDEVLNAIHSRPAPWYSEAFVPYLDSLWNKDSRVHFFFSVANAGWNPDFGDPDV